MKLIIVFLTLGLFCCKQAIKYPEGGYDYPKQIAKKDSNIYYYPLKGVESKKDAFGDHYSHLVYQWFEEPNLSIRPFKNDIFRITYVDAFGGCKLLILTEGQLTAKEGETDGLYDRVSSKLSSLEQFHLKILDRHYPLEEVDEQSRYRQYIDSLIKASPYLLDSTYYHKLYEKSFVRTDKEFTYTTSKRVLTEDEYFALIRELNASGFWALPYVLECDRKEDIADGFSFTVEANTQNKYQVVRVQGCPNTITKFTIACQKIMDMAQLDEKTDLMWRENDDTTK